MKCSQRNAIQTQCSIYFSDAKIRNRLLKEGFKHKMNVYFLIN